MGSSKLFAGNRVTDDDPLQVGAAALESGADIVPVTKSDTTDDPAGPFRALIMDAEGAVKLTTAVGEDRTLASGLLAAKTIYQIKFTRVWSTGTGGQVIHGIV